jgi:D-glycero-alpha-D-manno-heptose 1-phosphate guanylyltransferase
MQAIILVNSRKNHLYNVVNDCPISMTETINKPFLEYIVESLKDANIKNIIFSLSYKDTVIESYFSDGTPWEMNIQYSYEKESIGTANAIKNAKEMIKNEYILIMNSDIYCPIDYHKLFRFSTEKNLDIVVIPQKISDISYSDIIASKDDKTIHFSHKSALNIPELTRENLYLIKTCLIDQIPIGKVSLENHMIPQWIEENKSVGCFESSQNFIDIGIPENYCRFIHDIRARNENYREQLLEYTELLLHETITPTSSQFIIWKSFVRNFFRNVYGETSLNYQFFINLKFEPDHVFITEDFRETLQNFLKSRLLYIKELLSNTSIKHKNFDNYI